MTNDDVIDAVSADLGLLKKDVRAVLERVAFHVAKSVSLGGSVRLSGLGEFTRGLQAARVLIHPATGQPMRVAAKRKPKFKASSALKNIIKG